MIPVRNLPDEKFTPLEAERPAACRGDRMHGFVLANAGSNTLRELLTGFTFCGKDSAPFSLPTIGLLSKFLTR